MQDMVELEAGCLTCWHVDLPFCVLFDPSQLLKVTFVVVYWWTKQWLKYYATDLQL